MHARFAVIGLQGLMLLMSHSIGLAPSFAWPRLTTAECAVILLLLPPSHTLRLPDSAPALVTCSTLGQEWWRLG
eukprot:1144747-Pelagomonas_calceolata.AAC.3